MYSNALRICVDLVALMTYTVPYRAPPINCALASVAKSDSSRVA